MVYQIKPTKKGRWIVIEKIKGKAGFGSTKIRANCSTKPEAMDWIRRH